MFELLFIALFALSAGTLGTMLGLGGGVMLVPVLTLIFGVDIKTAVAASAIAVVANSLSGTGFFLQNRVTNIKLAYLLLIGMTIGALIGGMLVISINPSITKGLFGLLLFYVSYVMSRPAKASSLNVDSEDLALDTHGLSGSYWDRALREEVVYTPDRLRVGLPTSTLGGLASGMFGIGGGPITVPLLTLIMNVPVKAAAATSSFMVGMTAATSASVYYASGNVNPRITLAAIFGIVVGAKLGNRIQSRTRPQLLKRIFVVVLFGLGIMMLLQAAGVV